LWQSLALLCFLLLSTGQLSARPLRVSVLDFGSTETGKSAAEKLRANLKSDQTISITDAQLAMSAARGIGYSGSLNLSVAEARDLGAALDADFYIIGDAQTIRRTSTQSPAYFESYCSLFIVSSHSGQLLFWERPSFEDREREKAEQSLVQHLSSVESRRHCIDAILQASQDERARRAIVVVEKEPVLEAPDDEKAAEAQGLRLPRPYQRFRPAYPETAARAEAEATVDVLVDVGADGEITNVQIARWGGFGLDEVTMATVKRMHFFPAHQNGTPIAMRVLLRYNFRKPPK
jgi:TonB family protein